MPAHFPAPRRPVGYALNVFPCETFEDWWACLNTEVLEIKRRVFPGETFPIEMRFSERLVAELTSVRIAQLRQFLRDHDLALVTVNAFVMPHFHGERVKERVYLPAWHESDARVHFTNTCLDLLSQFAVGRGNPPDCPPLGLGADEPSARPYHPSVSVPFGALKPVTMDAVAPNILKCAEYAAATGCMLALEPEPGLCVETTEEILEFFCRFVPDRLRPHLGVNYDLAHQLVEFEQLADSVGSLLSAGVSIAKIHVSNAAEMTELKPFYEDSIYLHQTTGADKAGTRTFFSLDWPDKVPSGIAKYRVHYHLPVCPSDFSSTLAEVERFLANPPDLPSSVPFIIETYTWPQQLRGRDRLVENICRELMWVRKKVSM